MASMFRLEKPERVAVAVECCYQNTGIATSVALTMFENNDAQLAVAVGVPLFYGICEAVLLAVYCLVCWKMGWTKAPRDENFCTVLFTTYEVKELMEEDPQAIEVVLGSPDKGGDPSNMIFARSQGGGYQFDEGSLDSLSRETTTEESSTPQRKTSLSDFSIDDEGDALEDSTGGESAGAGGGSRRSRGNKKYTAIEMTTTAMTNHENDPATTNHSSPPQSQQQNPTPPPRMNGAMYDSDGNMIMDSNGNPIRRAISSLRARADSTGKSKYTKAEILDDDDEEEGTRQNGIQPLPAEGKQLD
mmetsp:Transcript_20094/g.46606  ORF Transcript_20094/g.46606 Transcript_20094/m.46606 type:complete len:302 (-) Transcript_20094:73-978(-)